MNETPVSRSTVGSVFQLTEAVGRKIATTGLLLAMLVVVVDVLDRDILGGGIPGSVEINEYLLVIIAFMAIVQTNGVKGHITVDLLYGRLPRLGQILCDRISNVVVLLFALSFLYASWAKAVAEFDAGETSWFGSYVLPVWMFRWVVPLSCILLVVQVGISILEDIRKSRAGA